MKKDKRLVEIERLIDELFGDTRVSKEQTLEWAEEIASKCEGMIDALKEDIKRDA